MKNKNILMQSEVFTPHVINFRRPAFTLAEVLITLGIIGIVAALTLPNLIANHQKKVLSVQAKTAYSLVSQAFVKSIEKNGDSEYWQQGATTRTIFEQYLFPELKGISSRGNLNLYKDCEKYLTKTKINVVSFATGNSACFLLPNGMIVFPLPETYRQTYVLSSVIIDVNGFKNPNMEGKDVFQFIIIEKTDGKWGESYSYAFGDGGQMKAAPTTGVYPNGYGLSEYCNSSDPRFGIAMRLCIAKLMEDGWEFKDDYPW